MKYIAWIHSIIKICFHMDVDSETRPIVVINKPSNTQPIAGTYRKTPLVILDA